jgi:uncharacterized protein YkwD
MRTLSRRTLIVLGPFTLAPVRLLAEPSSERIAEGLIADAIDEGRARLAPGLSARVRDARLDDIARERSEDMARGAAFAHENERGGIAAIEKIRARYSRFGAMGENLMMDFDPAGRAYDPQVFARRAVKSWLESEGHRDNIVSPAFRRSGIGVAASRTMVYATQVFWGPPMQRDQRRGSGQRSGYGVE